MNARPVPGLDPHYFARPEHRKVTTLEFPRGSGQRRAEKTRLEMTALKADNEKLLAQARSEREVILRGAKEIADKMVADSRDKAEAEGRRMLEQAREAMQNERQALVAEMKKEIVTLSLDIAEKVLRKELSDKTAQENLVSDLVSNSRLN